MYHMSKWEQDIVALVRKTAPRAKPISKAEQLPLPPFFDPSKADDIGMWVNPTMLQLVAEQWRRIYQIPAANRMNPIIGIDIDRQIGFCHTKAPLYVAGKKVKGVNRSDGAVHDNRRSAEFVHRNLHIFDILMSTMDTHGWWSIFFSAWFRFGRRFEYLGAIYEKGDPIPDNFLVTLEMYDNGTVVLNPDVANAIDQNYAALNGFLRYYLQELIAGQRYEHVSWVGHTLLGDIQHALMPINFEANLFHSMVRASMYEVNTKGDALLVEKFSPIRAEVYQTADGIVLDELNSDILEAMMVALAFVAWGEAGSHCWRFFIEDLLTFIREQDESLVEKVYIVKDLISPVVIYGPDDNPIPGLDYYDQQEKAFERFAAAGMHLVESTTPMHLWPNFPIKA